MEKENFHGCRYSVRSRINRGSSKPASILSFVLILCLVAHIAVWGQLATGSIAGTVKDSSGAVTPGVQMTVRNTDTGIARTLQTEANGRYSVTNLAPGTYEVHAELTGFGKGVRQGITVTIGREAVVDFSLSPGEVQEQVVVTGEAPLVDTSSAAVTGLVDQQQVTDLPLNGRSLTQLTTLQPGVLLYRINASALTGTGQNISVNGARDKQINFLLNGTSILNYYGKSPGGVSGDQMGVEGVREFSILSSSYSAEFGKSAGGIINAVTKSGTNSLHGSLYEYIRNSSLDAKSFWENFTGAAKPQPFKRNQFGGSVGGPLRKDKVFFFANVEILRERLGQTNLDQFPDAASRRGVLPGLAPFTVASGVAPYLNLMPVPSTPSIGTSGTAIYSFTFSQPTNQQYVNGRIDHRFSDSDSLFGSYVIDDSIQTQATVPHFTADLPNRSQYVSLEESHIFSPIWLNTAHMGFNRSKAILSPTCDATALALDFVPGSGLCPRFTASGFTLPTAQFGPRIFILNSFQPSDTISWARGDHQLKFGFSMEHFQLNGRSAISPGGNYGFSGLQNFLLGNMTFFESPKPGVNSWKGLRQNLFALFANDTMKVRSDLTVNLGVRYEFITSPTEVHNYIANIDTPTSPASRTGGALFANPSLKNFSPRIGMAWSPGASQKTALRAGFGIFYEQLVHSTWMDGGFQVPPYWYEGRFTGTAATPVPFPNAYSVVQSGTVPFPSSFIFTTDGHPPQPLVLQYNLSVQQQLPGQIVVQAAYVGSGGRHIERHVDNAAPPTILNGSYFFPAGSARLNPNFAEVRFLRFDTTTSYHSLQMSARRRFAQGIAFQLSYTWAKSLDDQSGAQGQGDTPNDSYFATLLVAPKFDRGRSSYDARQNFVANFTADLPFGPGKLAGRNLTGAAAKLLGGWQAQGVLTLQTGLTTGALLSFDNARMASTRFSQRPNLASSCSKSSGVLGTPNQFPNAVAAPYLNPACFSLAPAGFLGNLGRNAFDGPGLAALDFSLIKSTSVTEKLKLEFRAEFFNLLNHANFGYPSSTGTMIAFTAPGQAQPVGNFSTLSNSPMTTSPRQIQLALKLTF